MARQIAAGSPARLNRRHSSDTKNRGNLRQEHAPIRPTRGENSVATRYAAPSRLANRQESWRRTSAESQEPPPGVAGEWVSEGQSEVGFGRSRTFLAGSGRMRGSRGPPVVAAQQVERGSHGAVVHPPAAPVGGLI
jgi:hypothetical protein